MWRHCSSFFLAGFSKAPRTSREKFSPLFQRRPSVSKKIMILQKLAETLTRISPPSLLFSFRLAFSPSFHYVSSASWLQAMTKATRYTNPPPTHTGAFPHPALLLRLRPRAPAVDRSVGSPKTTLSLSSSLSFLILPLPIPPWPHLACPVSSPSSLGLYRTPPPSSALSGTYVQDSRGFTKV